ncbi:glycosyltransferase family 4 protein [Nocardioides conyzicola]|uniref:Glycosyltransferase subfamily 4-like N-terminal domain-containing protein n=1 Tax=Nocardioides conyzicola TaxID=1651781 RepID=A0ABP8WKA7_9ACTN
MRGTTSGRALRAARALRNGPAAVTVATRHLARGSDHVQTVPQPWLGREAYRSAQSALRDGDLMLARDRAARAGLAGRVLGHLVDGELGTLSPTVPDGPRTLAPRSAPGTTRVLHLVSSALPEIVAGYTLRTQGIASAQQRAGHDVHVVTQVGFPVTRGHLAAEAEVVVDGVPHHRMLPVRLPFRADVALRADIEGAARLVQRLRPTVLHAHSNHVNGQVGLALRSRFGIPLVYEVRGLLEETWLSRGDGRHSAASDFYRLNRAAETAVMRAADVVVVLNEALRDEVVARRVPAERVHVVPNCVDRSWLEHPVAEPSPGRQTLTVGLVGTLNAYEGLDVLVDAVAARRAAGSDVRLLVVGDGAARADLVRLAADRGLGDAATFTGRVPYAEVRAAYARLDVFCLPRLDLPVTRLVPPLKPVEAMALGIPVVASDLAPLRELVGEDRGILFPAGDAGALAAALAGLADPDLRRTLGAAAQHWVAETRTWEAAATRYQQIYALTRGENP